MLGTIDGLERFDGNTEPHAHFICKQCAAVISIRERQCLKATSARSAALTEASSSR